MLRFLMPTEPVAKVHYSKPVRKRESNVDTELFNQTLLDLCNNDSWSPLVRGYPHRLKRQKQELYKDPIQNAMIGVF